MQAKNFQYTLVFIASFIWSSAIPAVAQNSQIPWSAFTAGFGASTSINTTLTSAVGQPLVGTTVDANTGIASGFLADTIFAGPVTGVEENLNEPLPSAYELEQNYPNPFNPSTTIGFHLPQPGFVTLKIYDVFGHEVATLVNEKKPAGIHHVIFEVSELASGVYFYRLQAGKFTQTRKMLLIR